MARDARRKDQRSREARRHFVHAGQDGVGDPDGHDEAATGGERRVPVAEPRCEPAPEDHRTRRQQRAQDDHQEVEGGPPGGRVGIADGRWVGGVLEEGHQGHGDPQPRGDHYRRGPGAEAADAAEREAVDERGDAAERDPVEHDAGAETGRGLEGPADRGLPAVVVSGPGGGLFDGDGRVHLGLTEEVRDEEGGHAGQQAGEHAPDEQGAGGCGVHVRFPCRDGGQ
ncbi:hypothetical protein ADK89_09545 [Streptomyces sp. XY37]|nr:hypothetical protein ADK89_09545 [Streptomyces sp. XY37]